MCKTCFFFISLLASWGKQALAVPQSCIWHPQMWELGKVTDLPHTKHDSAWHTTVTALSYL